MSTSQAEDAHHTVSVSSFGVFGILAGILAGGILLAYVLTSFKGWLAATHGGDDAGRLHAKIKDRKAAKRKTAEGETKDLEAGITTISEKPWTHHKRLSLASIRTPTTTLHRRSQEYYDQQRRQKGSDLKASISRPKRLLPSAVTYVIVRSPLHSAGSHHHLAITSPRASRAHSLHSPRLPLVPRNMGRPQPPRLADGTPAAEPPSDVPPVNAPFANQPHTGRRVVWFDELASPLPSRTSRTNSLPSSWHEVLPSSAADATDEGPGLARRPLKPSAHLPSCRTSAVQRERNAPSRTREKRRTELLVLAAVPESRHAVTLFIRWDQQPAHAHCTLSYPCAETLRHATRGRVSLGHCRRWLPDIPVSIRKPTGPRPKHAGHHNEPTRDTVLYRVLAHRSSTCAKSAMQKTHTCSPCPSPSFSASSRDDQDPTTKT
ncbi:hypothetical protein PCANC_20705 [Puccinia coronata f. sp. avenae]|uniref:Uncharacterized protein n=1 Tax=Puccinia coronata f. sp. avenae TaxID=200324 RepID=A0A2N5SRS7_9BASI|nr:hypothetical protein PCASD_18988 [Puccinia coronata f. sp. avenae]PLW32024.1 hypothetical protein PCANC_20705 [Puccinia coronata f. sp. avenae]